MSNKAGVITEHDWESQRPELRQLYLEKNLPLPKVMKIMEETHHFFAKKNQYEKYFREWSWAKNRTQDFWRQIDTVKRDRKLRGMDSEFYDRGKKISEKQVERYTERYGNFGIIHRAPPHGLPPGITVCSPQSNQIPSLDRALPLSRALSPGHIQFFTADLPFHLFENSFHEKRTHLGRHGEPWSTVLDDPLTIDPRILTEYGEFDLIRSQHSGVEETASIHHADPMVVDLSGNSISETSTIPGPILTALDSIMPPKSSGKSSCDSLIHLDDLLFSSPLHRKMLFSLSNNFAGIGGFPVAEVLRYLEKETGETLYRFIFSSRKYSSRAIAQNLFRAAIEAGDARIVDLLLSEQSVDIDPNTEVCHAAGDVFTPLERACSLGHEATIRTLFKHKADVNRSSQSQSIYFGSSRALYCALTEFGQRNVLESGIFQLFLDAGARVEQHNLEHIIDKGYDELFTALMSKHARENYAEWSGWGVFLKAILKMQNKTLVAMVEKLIEVGADLNHDHWDPRSFDRRRLINAAAQLGNLELFNTLASQGAALTGDTLPCAIMGGNLELVQALLDRGLDANSLGFLGATPLAAAIRSKSPELRNLFIEKCGPYCIKDKRHFSSVLKVASKAGDVEFIKYIVHLGGDASPMVLGSALETVAKEGIEEAAQFLINSGADLGSEKALRRALRRRHIRVVNMLLHADAPILSSKPMMLAVRWGERSVIKALIFAGACLNSVGLDHQPDIPLILAVKQKDQGLVELLLEAGADINSHKTNETVLCAAVANGDIQMARYLLSQGADPHDSAALQAAASSNAELFELLLNKYVERYPLGRKRYGSAVLKSAIEVGDESAARMLLERGADPNDLPDEKYGFDATSAFGFAIMKQQRTVHFVEMYLQAKCDPNGIVAQTCIRPHSNQGVFIRITALLAAVGTCSTSIVELLIQKGARVNFPATGPVKRTPLQRAAEIGSISMVQLLLRHGADINARPARTGGGSALQLAAIGGYIPIVCALMSLQADVNAPGSIVDGRTALEGASEHGRLDTVQILLNGGAGCKENGQRQLKRAIKLAKDNGHFSVSDLLKNVAANEAADSGEFIDWEPREEGGSSSRALSR